MTRFIKKNQAEKSEKIIITFLLSVTTIWILLSMKANPWSQFINGHDSSMFLYFGKGMSKGLVPYVDMFDHKGPVLFFIQFLATLFGENLNRGIWLVEIIFLSGTLFFTYKTCHLLTKNSLLSAVAITMNTGLFIRCFEGGNLSEEYALFFIALSLYLFTKLLVNATLHKNEYLLIGASGGLVFFMRGNMIALWIVFCLYLLIHGLYQKKYKQLGEQVLFIFLGGSLVVLLVIFYSTSTGSLREMLYQAFIMNIQYSSVSASEQLSAAGNFFDLLSQAGITIMLALYIFYLAKVDKKTPQFTIACLFVVYFVINFLTVTLSGRFYLHYLTTQLIVIVVMSALVIHFLLEKIAFKSLKWWSLVFLLFTISFNWQAIQNYPWVITRQFSVQKNEFEEIANYIRANTEAEDTIYVHNIDANLYLMSDRFANSRFFVLPSLNYEEFPELSAEFSEAMEINPPKFIVVRKNFIDELHSKKRLNAQLAQVIEKDYVMVEIQDNWPFFIYEYQAALH